MDASDRWDVATGWIDSRAVMSPSLTRLRGLEIAAPDAYGVPTYLGGAGRDDRVEMVWLHNSSELPYFHRFWTHEGSIRGMRIRSGADARIESVWNSPAYHLPTGRPTVAASDDGFVVAWRAWGGDGGYRAVSATLDAAGRPGPIRDVWRSTAVIHDVLAVGRGSRRGVVFADPSTREILFRRLGPDGTPAPEAFRVGTLPLAWLTSMTRAASDDQHVFVLSGDLDSDRMETVTCFPWENPMEGFATTGSLVPRIHSLLVPGEDGVRVVQAAGEERDPRDDRLLEVALARCTTRVEAPAIRLDEHHPVVSSQVLFRGEYRMSRLAWNGSRLIVAFADADDVVWTATVEPGRTFDGIWNAVVEAVRLPFSLTGLPDGRTILSWAGGDLVKYRILDRYGRPSGDEVSWVGSPVGAPSVATGPAGTAVAWTAWAPDCQPRVVRLDGNLLPEPPVVLDDPVRCAYHPWPAAIGATDTGFRIYWAHDTGPTSATVVIRVVDWDGVEVTGETICQGEATNDPIAGFGPPVRTVDDVVFLAERPDPPRWAWNPWFPPPVFLQAGVLAIDLRSRRVTEWAFDPTMACRRCNALDPAVVAHRGNAVALFPVRQAGLDGDDAISIRRITFDGLDEVDPMLVGEEPKIEAVDAVVLGTTTAVLWSEARSRDSFGPTLLWTLRLGLMPTERLP